MSLTPEQHRERATGLGSSDAGVVAHVSPFKSALELYYEKRGEVPPSAEETEAMEWGTLLEEPIAQKFSRVTGLKVRRQPLKRATATPFMLASIDRQVLGETAILECKALNAFTRIDGVLDLPDYIYLQCQHQLEVYGYERLHLALLLGGQRFLTFPVERDQPTIDVLIEIEAEFWRRVELGDPPPPDGSDACKDLMKRLYPQDSGKIIALTSDDALATVLALEAARTDLKDAEDRKTAAENWVKFRMEEASVCRIPQYGEITWKRARGSKSLEVNEALLKEKYPEIYKEVIVEREREGARRFLLKPQKGVVPA